MVSYVHKNLPLNVLLTLPHSWCGESHGQETFLGTSADNQIRDCDKECSNHHPSLSTLRSKGLS